MKKFIFIICFQSFAFSAFAGMTCENLFNQTSKATAPAIDNVKSAQIINQLTEVNYFADDRKRVALAVINDLIKKKMFNNPDLAYTVVLYLNTYKPQYGNKYYSTIQKIVNNKEIYPLLKSGRRIKFENPSIEKSVDTFLATEESLEKWIGLWHLSSLDNPETAYKLWLGMARPSKNFDLIQVVNEITQHIVKYHSNPQSQALANLTSEIPQYNLFKAVKASLKYSLTHTPDHYQEIIITTTRYTSQKRIVVISSQPIENADINMYGISIKILENIDENASFENKMYTWSIGGQTSSAQITYKKLGTADIKIAGVQSPNYTQMLQNHKLTGVIAVSHNLKDYASDLADIYLDYFRTLKFRIESTKILSGDQVRDFLLNTTEANEIDYLIREGHSESGSDALMSLSSKMKIHKLTTKRNDITEEIYLIIPQVKKNAPVESVLELTSFGQALRSREKNNQFIYVNSACMATCYTSTIYRTVAAPGFVPLSSPEVITTFTPESGGFVYEVLNGLRSGSDYKTIRKRIKDYNKHEQVESLVSPDMGREYMEPEMTQNIPITDQKIKRFFNQEPPVNNP